MKEVLLEPFLRQRRISAIGKYIPKNSVLCDIGCGHGDFLRMIEGKIKFGVGIDKEIDPFDSKKLSIRKMEIKKKLNLKPGYFDCVTCLAVLEHLDYPESILKESYRILKRNGVMIITVPSPMSKPVLEFLSYKLKIVDPKQISDHKSYFSKSQLKNLLEKNKFRNIFVTSFEFGMNNLAVAYK